MSFIKTLLSSSTWQAILFLLATALTAYSFFQRHRLATLTKPISVNFHISRRCNKTCKFCFHTETSSHFASKDDMQRGMLLLKKAGMRKINFAGGDPFLYADRLGWLSQYCKEELNLESVSIITNGTKVTKSWLDKYGQFVGVMGVSCDSFDEKTNELDKRKRDARELLISSDQFEEFCRKHRHLDSFVPEPNDLMASSYLILDEYLCFLDKGSGEEKHSRSILEVGVARALEEVSFDKGAFVKRGGLYEWSREANQQGCVFTNSRELD